MRCKQNDGLALVDTMIFSRAANRGARYRQPRPGGRSGYGAAHRHSGDAFPEQRGQPLDDFAVEKVRPLAEKAALVPAVNAARAMYGVLTAIVVIAVL